MKKYGKTAIFLLFPLLISGCSLFPSKDDPKPAVTNYSVSFNANGGQGKMSKMATSGSTFVAPRCKFTFEDHTFQKWALNSATGKTYEVGDIIKNIKKNITLFAIWEENEPTPDPSEAQAYATAFNNLKSSVTSGHNYTMTIHSYLEGYEDDPETVYDDEYVMINNKIFYHNNEYSSLGGKEGIISQKNQGFVNFDYYGNNVLPDGFYSTRTDAGITDLTDLVGENLFLGAFTQDTTNVSKFKSTNADLMAVIANFIWDYPELISRPQEVYYIVNSDKDKATLHSIFTYWTSDGGVDVEVRINSTFEFSCVGTTSNAKLEQYLENPTTTYSTPTQWTDEQKELFGTRYAGTYPTFISGLSYSLDVFENLDKDDGKYKILVQDFGSNDKRSAYGTQLVENELFTDYSTSEKTIYKRVDIDNEKMTQTTYVVEMSYLSPSETTSFGIVSRRYPNGIFQATFYATITNMEINTVQLLNEYFSTKGYTNFVPQFSISPSTSVTKFVDSTDSKNVSQHNYELYTSTFRIYIDGYDNALSALNEYVTAIKNPVYGFTDESAFVGNMRSYGNTTRYKATATIVLTDLSKYSASTYSGFIEVWFNISAEKDESDIPHVVGLSISGYQTDFTVGDTFAYGGSIDAELSSGSSTSLAESDVTFTGYDMSKGGNQTVTVTYTCDDGTFYKYYTIHVASNVNYTCSFKLYGDDFILKLNLCEDGSGTYIFQRAAKIRYQYFTYVINGDQITFTLTRCDEFSDFTKFSLFASQSIGVTRIGTYDSELETIVVQLSTTTGTQGENRTFTL